MKIKLLVIVFFLFCFAKSDLAQISSASIGGSLHLGSIQSNSVPVTTFGGTFFVDFFPWFEHDVSFRLGYTYTQKVEYFLPEDRTGRYYPLQKTISLKGYIRQDISYPVYIEEGAGFIYLNDKTLANLNSWELGAGFGAAIGIDFRKDGFKGITIGGGLDYGVCFTGSNAYYYLFFVQTQYYF
jgi:hypothetical protein